MSDLEYDLLDELYFIQSFQELSGKLQWNHQMLRDTLTKLFQKDWIRCFATPEDELFAEEIDLEIQYHTYFYQASKLGLMAHNTTDQDG